MKAILFFFTLLLSSISITAYSQDVITVGTTPFNPPFAMVADSSINFFGFDIDIMMEICKRINKQCKFTPVEFGKILDQIKAGRIDLGIAAIILTPGLQTGGWLPSLPYLESSARFFTLRESPLKELNDISRKTVGVTEGTLYRRYAQSVFNNNVYVKTYPNLIDMLQALQNKEVDVLLTDGKDAEYWVNNNAEIYKYIGDKLPIGAGYTIVSIPQKSDLIKAINQALLQMQDDGTYLNIYNKYFSVN